MDRKQRGIIGDVSTGLAQGLSMRETLHQVVLSSRQRGSRAAQRQLAAKLAYQATPAGQKGHAKTQAKQARKQADRAATLAQQAARRAR